PISLAVRPLQVNPPAQFLNTLGGVSRIGSLAIVGDTVEVDGKARVFASTPPDAAFATPFDAGLAVMRLADGTVPAQARVEDPTGLASGMLLYRWTLAPGQTREVALVVPLEGAAQPPQHFDVARAQRETAALWQEKLGQVRLRLPEEGKALADTLRTALA